MPKRSGEHEESPTSLKRTRSAVTLSSRSLDYDHYRPSESPTHSHRRRTLTSVSPSLVSDTSSNTLDPRLPAIRRRMNPDSLAGRLGPALVKELESLLEPGMTEMPSFAVRQEIQQRYNIDRRHIYDWFHNKGLRVTASEKREEKRASKLATERPPPDTRIQRRIRQQPMPEVHSSTSSPGPKLEYPMSRTSTPMMPPPVSIPTPPLSVSGNLVPYEAACHVHQPFYALAHHAEYAETCFYAQTQAFLYSQTYPSAAMPYIISALPEYQGAPTPSAETVPKAPLDRTSSWISEQQKIPYGSDVVVQSPVPDAENGQRDNLSAILPLDNEQTLPQCEREAFYQSLSEVLPPACGIEESVGTYKAYMTQQVQGYYDRLVSGGTSVPRYDLRRHSIATTPSGVTPVPIHTSAASPILHQGIMPYQIPLSHPPQTYDSSQATRGSEFSNWILYGGRSQAPSLAPSPSQTPSLSDTGTSSTGSILWPAELNLDQAERSDISCLAIDDILESPILRSRCSTSDIHPFPGPGYPGDTVALTKKQTNAAVKAKVAASTRPATPSGGREDYILAAFSRFVPGMKQPPSGSLRGPYQHMDNTVKLEMDDDGLPSDLMTAKEYGSIAANAARSKTRLRAKPM